MTTTKTRQVDRNGNISYLISKSGQTVGTVHKTCGGYQAELLSGSWAPVKSIKDGMTWIENLT